MRFSKRLGGYATRAYDGVVGLAHSIFEGTRGTNANLRRRLYGAEVTRDRLAATDQTQLNSLVSVRRENADLETEKAELETEKTKLENQVGRLENANRILGHSRSMYRRSFARAEQLVLRTAIGHIERGYSPLDDSGQRNGRYALIDRHGRVLAMSRKAQRIFGFKPGTVNYNDILSTREMMNLPDLDQDTVIDRLPVMIAEGKTTLRDVRVRPLITRGIGIGYLVDFQEIGRVERFRSRLARMRKRVSDREARAVHETSVGIVAKANRELGLE